MINLIDSSPIISSICLTILSLSNRTKKPKLNVLSALIFASLAIVSLSYNNFFAKNDTLLYYSTIVTNIILLLFFPLVNIYVTVYTESRIRIRKLILWLFPLLICAGFITMYAYIKADYVTSYFRIMISGHTFTADSYRMWFLHLVTWRFFNWYLAGIGLLCLIDSYQSIHLFRQKIKKSSPNNPTPLDYTNYSILLILVISSILLFILFALLHLEVNRTSMINLWANCTSTLIIVLLGHHMLRHNKKHRVYQLYTKTADTSPSPMHVAHEAHDQDTLLDSFETIHEKLNQRMNSDKLFLNSRLTIAELSDELGVNRNTLSKYFSTVLDISFNTYINHFRVAYAIDLMKEEYKNYTIDYIAQQSGFTNRTTFYRAFKKVKGKSPSTYIVDVSSSDPFHEPH